jgi:PKD repeat protein
MITYTHQMFNLMYKRLSLLLLLFACCFAWAQAQVYNVTLQGTIVETGTGNPIVNQDVYIYFDSSSAFTYFNIVQTNSSGAWIDVVSGVNVAGGNCQAYTFDCNGNYMQLGFYAYSAVNNSFSSTATMCAPSTSNCAAQFSSNHTAGTTTYTFIDFSNSGAPAASVNSWFWDFGDGTTSTLQNPVHSYNSMGPFRVCLTIGTTAGCFSTYCDSTTVGGGGGSCSAFFGYANNGCSFTFYDSSYASAGVAMAIWDFGDGNTATGSNPSHTYSANGIYNVCVTVIANDSCTDTYCYTVSCGSQPACQASYYWFPDSTGQYSIILVNTSTGSNLSYFWDFGDGDSSSQQYPSHVYAGPGAYIVCLTVYNALLGCSSTYCDSLLVLNKMSSSVPFSINVVSPLTAVAPPAAVGPAMQISPNPASSEVRLAINLENQGQGAIRLLDVQGRAVKAMDLGFLAAGLHQQTLDLSTMPDGIYLVELMVNGQRTVQKLVVTE